MAVVSNYHLAGTTDLSNSASWHNGSYSAGAVPIASGLTFFTEGSDNITAGLSTLNTAQGYVSFTRGFKGNLGASGSSATIGANTNGGAGEYATETLEYAAGGGSAYITAGSGGIDLVRVNSLGKLYLTGGTVSEIQVNGGKVHINDQVDLSAKTCNFYEGADVEIEWKADGTDPTLNMYGGVLFTKRTWGTVNMRGGVIIPMVEKEANWCATLNLDGGLVDWRCGSVATTINFNSGKCNFDKLVRALDISAPTITAADTELNVLGMSGTKVTWPATSSIIIKAGKAALSLARVTAAKV